MAVEVTQRQFTVDEYYRMAEAAIFTEDDRIELIDGAIIEMSPLGSPHVACVIRLDGLLWRSAPQDTLVSVQNPVRLSNFSEPQPDVMLLRSRADSYASHHPTPEDVLLLIEVSDSTVAYDRKVKLPLYARSGVVETWIVDIAHSRIEVYSQPTPSGYTTLHTYHRGDTIDSPTVQGLSLAVNAIVD